MNCRRCGVANADEMEFCRQCGASLHWQSVVGPSAKSDRQGIVGLAVAAGGLLLGLALFNSPLAPSLLNATSSSSPTEVIQASNTVPAVALAGETPTPGSRIRELPTSAPAKPDTRPLPGQAGNPAPGGSNAGAPQATPTRPAVSNPPATPVSAPTPTVEVVIPVDSEEIPPEEEAVEPDPEAPAEEPEEVPPDDGSETPSEDGATDPSETGNTDVPPPITLPPSQVATIYLNATAPAYARGRDGFNRFADQWNGASGFAASLQQDPGNSAVAASVTQAIQQARNEVNAAIIAIQQRQPPSPLATLRNRLTQALTMARNALLVAGNSVSSAPQPSTIDQATQVVSQASQDLARAAAELDAARTQNSTR